MKQIFARTALLLAPLAALFSFLSFLPAVSHTVFITGQDLPAMLRPRVERLIRLGAVPAGARA